MPPTPKRKFLRPLRQEQVAHVSVFTLTSPIENLLLS
jgi:hypothetical protein